MKKCGKLGFKNYLDSFEGPSVWNSPCLIVQIDSLMQVLDENDKYLIEGNFQLKYDMITLDVSDSLLAHVDDKTMERNDITNFNLFNTLLDHCSKIIMMGGGRCKREVPDLFKKSTAPSPT